ncbi:recombinase family protein [Dyadobacter luteus]|nr:recombinase family protein [Dyadobacter luteus]
MNKKLRNLFENVLRKLASGDCRQMVVNELNTISKIDINQKFHPDQCGHGVLFNALSEMYTEGRRTAESLMSSYSPGARYQEYLKVSVRTKLPTATIAADKFALELAPVIKRIRREGNTTLQAIADRLTDLEIPTPREGKWYPKTVSKVESRIKKLQQQ